MASSKKSKNKILRRLGNSLSILLQSLPGHDVEVELKNDIVIAGTLDTVEKPME